MSRIVSGHSPSPVVAPKQALMCLAGWSHSELVSRMDVETSAKIAKSPTLGEQVLNQPQTSIRALPVHVVVLLVCDLSSYTR